MTEPTLASQFLGIATIMTCLFIALLLIANSEQKARRKKEEQDRLDKAIIEVYQQGRNQFNNIARENIRNCDRQFTFDTQKPEGLRPELLALPYPKG
nr:MAG TPA: Glycine rich protein family [Caudoviricetes sp.]